MKNSNKPNVIALCAMKCLNEHMAQIEIWYSSKYYPQSKHIQEILGKAFQEIASVQYSENLFTVPEDKTDDQPN